MKKILLVILAFVHITTSTGAVVHLHYCMGELDNWRLTASELKTCGKCGMEELEGEDEGCCKDELKIVKNVADQKITQMLSPVVNLLTQTLPATFCQIPFFEIIRIAKVNPISRALLRINNVAIYIRNCIFLI